MLCKHQFWAQYVLIHVSKLRFGNDPKMCIKLHPSSAAAAAMIPAVGHTQRATIDCERNEIHVMTVSRAVQIQSAQRTFLQ